MLSSMCQQILMQLTANAIGIDQDWFRSLGSNDYGALTGAPETFAFASDSSGTIVKCWKFVG